VQYRRCDIVTLLTDTPAILLPGNLPQEKSIGRNAKPVTKQRKPQFLSGAPNAIGLACGEMRQALFLYDHENQKGNMK
jgi:hypothetical protein